VPLKLQWQALTRGPMRAGALLAASFLAIVITIAVLQAVRRVEAKRLPIYEGVYQWQGNGFLYLQQWSELTGKDQLVAFDESGAVRALYPTDKDRFFTGPGAAVATAVESRVEFRRDTKGRVTSLTWRREGGDPRTARRMEIESREEVRFPSGKLQLAGTLTAPATGGKHPAIILVHGSGPETRDHILPFARFLVRRGMAVLGYDKRGVGASMGDWKTASFSELADDVVAAFDYLTTRGDIDRTQIGLLGLSQAGWIMPLAAVRGKDIAFLISVSGAGVPAEETTIDHAQREMTASGMKPDAVDAIIALMKLQYDFARTGKGWERYAAARHQLASRMGAAPDTFPGTPDHPQFQIIRQSYLYDPAPTLRQLRTPVLALFGALDNNILPEKNRDAWDSALRSGGHRDYTLRILGSANHEMFEAKVGNNKEMVSLPGFVPAYFEAIEEWLAPRIRGFPRPEPPNR